jgi:hypothetical protein
MVPFCLAKDMQRLHALVRWMKLITDVAAGMVLVPAAALIGVCRFLVFLVKFAYLGVHYRLRRRFLPWNDVRTSLERDEGQLLLIRSFFGVIHQQALWIPGKPFADVSEGVLGYAEWDGLRRSPRWYEPICKDNLPSVRHRVRGANKYLTRIPGNVLDSISSLPSQSSVFVADEDVV